MESPDVELEIGRDSAGNILKVEYKVYTKDTKTRIEFLALVGSIFGEELEEEEEQTM